MPPRGLLLRGEGKGREGEGNRGGVGEGGVEGRGRGRGRGISLPKLETLKPPMQTRFCYQSMLAPIAYEKG